MNVTAIHRGRMIVFAMALALAVSLAGCEANDTPVIDTSTPPKGLNSILVRKTARPGPTARPAANPVRR
jgi:hypothetical protein